MRRVAVAAVAAATAVGDDLKSTMAAMLAGRNGFEVVERFDTSASPNHYAAFRDESSVDDLVAHVVDGLGQTGKLTVDRAYFAGEPNGPFPSLPSRIAHIGERSREESGWDRVYTGACVASSSALIDAAALIANGQARCVLVVAARVIDAGTFFPFSAASAMTKDDETRPFTTGRSGLLLGDGAAAFLLCAADTDEVEPLAEIRGWGRAGDGFHVCQPEPTGRGMAVAIRAALDRAGLHPVEIGHVSAHGTGTQLNDSAESAALEAVFGTALSGARISSPKSAIGHTLEAAGLVEAAIAVQAIADAVVPPNLGRRADDESLCSGVVEQPQRLNVLDHVLSLNLAFGGSNTALVISRWDAR